MRLDDFWGHFQKIQGKAMPAPKQTQEGHKASPRKLKNNAQQPKTAKDEPKTNVRWTTDRPRQPRTAPRRP